MTTEQLEAFVEAAGEVDNLSTSQRADLFTALEIQPDGVCGLSAGAPELSQAALDAGQKAASLRERIAW